MKQTETSKAKILFIDTPKYAIAYDVFSISPTEPLEFGVTLECDKVVTRTLPHGNWTLLNTLDAVTEDEAEMVMPDFFDVFEQQLVYWHKENEGTIFTETAQMALHSLASSLGINEGKWVILYELKK